MFKTFQIYQVGFPGGTVVKNTPAQVLMLPSLSTNKKKKKKHFLKYHLSLTRYYRVDFLKSLSFS